MTTTTTNYGWVKPDVGASDDVWGGYINTDLDGIDAIVKGVSVVANAAYPASNPSGYQTAAQVASVVIGDNRICNGDMRIDQRNNGASGTAVSGYMIDRWKSSFSQTGKLTYGRNLNSIGGPAGFPYYLGFQSSSAYTPVGNDNFSILQGLEADTIGDFGWGVAGGTPVTLSFWARSSLTGQFGGAFLNLTGTSFYPFAYSLPTANTWTKISLTVPGDVLDVWTMTGTAFSMMLSFDLGAANFRHPANAWTTSPSYGATGSVNVVATNGATFYVTGVKLEIGTVATPYNRQSLAKSMADCQRYYSSTVAVFNANTTLSGAYQAVGSLPVTMRATPTLTGVTTGTAGGFANAVGTLSVSGNAGYPASTTVADSRTCTAAVAPGIFATVITASAEL
jgi:hypothetical protein